MAAADIKKILLTSAVCQGVWISYSRSIFSIAVLICYVEHCCCYYLFAGGVIVSAQ